MAVGFNKEGARRIVTAVKRVEQMPTDRTGGQTPRHDAGEESFWAMLIGRDLNGNRFSWSRVQPVQETDGSVAYRPSDPMIRGDENAFEVNGSRGIPTGAIVKMSLAAYDPDGQPLYSFVFNLPDQASTLPIHDHRDNFNGGFAFSVYHPGTALPQQPWAL